MRFKNSYDSVLENPQQHLQLQQILLGEPAITLPDDSSVLTRAIIAFLEVPKQVANIYTSFNSSVLQVASFRSFANVI